MVVRFKTPETGPPVIEVGKDDRKSHEELDLTYATSIEVRRV